MTEPRPVPFVVLSTQRTGSTWVIDMLNSHPRVTAYSELFLEGGKGAPQWGGNTGFPFWETFAAEREDSNGHDPLVAYLDELFAPDGVTEAIGFKLMYGQAGAHPRLVGELVHRGARFVHLKRANLLDVILSRDAAVARDLFHAREAARPPAIEVDVRDIRRRLEKERRSVEKAAERFSSLGVAYREVTYEDLVAKPDTFERLLAFLSVTEPDRELGSSLKKINPTRHDDLVTNIAALREALSGTAWSTLIRS